MKKFFSMMVALAALFAFTACGEDDNPTVEPTKCSKPTLRVTDKGDDYFTVEWKAVAGAASYAVEFNAKVTETAETKITFTEVAPGDYKVRVMAVAGEGYIDSEYAEVSVNVKPADTGDWFTQEVSLGTKEDINAYPYNSLFTTWKGTGVVSLYAGVFDYSASQSYTNDDIKAYLEAVEEEHLVSTNSEEGCKLVWSPLAAGTAYEVITYAVNEYGYEIWQRDVITTEAAEMADYVAEWIGTWNVTADKTLEFFVDGEYLNSRILDESYDMTWEIAHYPQYSDAVLVLGVSRIFPVADGYEFACLAKVNENKTLELVAGIQVADANGGYAPIWVPSFYVEEAGNGNNVYMPFSDFGTDDKGNPNYFAAYTFTLNGTTAVSTPGEATLTATDNNGNKTDVHAITDSFDIYAVSQDGVAVYGDFDNGGTTKVNSGTFTMTKAAAAASVSAKVPGQKKMIMFNGVKKTEFQFTR